MRDKRKREGASRFPTSKALQPTAQGRAAAQPPSAPWVTDHTIHKHTPKGFYK